MEKTLSFQIKEDEIDIFQSAFDLSGFRSKSEFIRYLLFEAIKDFYGDL